MGLKLLESFIVRHDPAHRHDHWQGGPPTHDQAVCPRCDEPLYLFWDLDANDPRFVTKQGRPIFSGMRRLTLYWCVPCCKSIDYRLVDDQRVEILAIEGEPSSTIEKKKRDPTFPYPNFPAAFKRRPIDLFGVSQLPKTVVKLLSAEPAPKLTAARKRLLEFHVGHDVSARTFEVMRTWAHQFGGKPYLPQGDEGIVCRNENCSSHGKRMHVIAAIRNDPTNELPIIETVEDVRRSNGFFNYFIVVYFHVCKRCYSIHGHTQGS